MIPEVEKAEKDAYFHRKPSCLIIIQIIKNFREKKFLKMMLKS